ncbi:YwdI family protein [Sporosarcina thermotolerans]|uniref:YwdI family protein n=1 Tax=Sporosarcina thermotolerans TaxID=633404 RepID=A0AAW9A678_9BACL|nr:YwdI family protein [Sporosarcina thermotolerans]MDW0116444.1 YwdI family protein [Sporosarcina thermotolerans]WHT48389.1 YwdI family protein [Sporosarcina thermotolerans]
MITNERIIEEMERQLSFAKSAKDDQTVREALTAVRALCQVVLGETNTERQEEPIITPRTMAISHKPLLSSLEGKPLDEEDANGGSIFDF